MKLVFVCMCSLMAVATAVPFKDGEKENAGEGIAIVHAVCSSVVPLHLMHFFSISFLFVCNLISVIDDLQYTISQTRSSF